MRVSRAALALSAVLLSCAARDDAPAPRPQGWHVADGAIRDPDGRTVILRGANLSSAHKKKPYLSDFGPADYARLQREWGLGAVRFLVSWAGIEPERGVYDEAYLDAIGERLDWARDAGLLVVLDMHQDLFGEGFGGDGAPRWTCDASRYAAFVPATPWFLGYLDPNVIACFDRLWTDPELRAHFVDAWRRLAGRFAGRANVIGFDILNEPHWGSMSIIGFEEERLAPFYVDVIKAVREQAPRWLVVAEPSASRNLGYPSTLPKLPFEGVVYAPHAYDSDAESGKGFSPERREAITRKLREMRDEATAQGAALLIGEYGGVADDPGITPYMDAQYDAAGAVAASTMYWAYDKDDGYGMLRPDGREKTELMDVVARPYPARVAGALEAYAYDEGAKVLTVRMRPDASVSAPTEIAAPARVWPDGAAVECGGCRVEQVPGLIRLFDIPAGDTRVVTVRAR